MNYTRKQFAKSFLAHWAPGYRCLALMVRLAVSLVKLRCQKVHGRDARTSTKTTDRKVSRQDKRHERATTRAGCLDAHLYVSGIKGFPLDHGVRFIHRDLLGRHGGANGLGIYVPEVDLLAGMASEGVCR